MSSANLNVVVKGLSDVGVVREENQDSLKIQEPSEPELKLRKGTMVALADGMGGLEEGSTASRLAVESVVESYFKDDAPTRTALERSVKDANRAIYAHAHAVEGGCLMGSTLTALVVVGGSACIAQVGDSRAYRYRGGAIEQVTRDHSLVRELADRGEIDESSAQYSFHRNVLTRGLGLRDEVEVDLYELHDLAEGDEILLSSDGLHEQVHADEMAGLLETYGSDLDGACREMVRIARERGGPDNITVAIVRITKEEALLAEAAAAVPAWRRRGGDEAMGWLLPLVVFLSFAAGVVLTLVVQSPPPIAPQAFQQLEAEVDAALGDRRPEVDPAARAERLREHLERIRRILRRE